MVFRKEFFTRNDNGEILISIWSCEQSLRDAQRGSRNFYGDPSKVISDAISDRIVAYMKNNPVFTDAEYELARYGYFSYVRLS